VRFGWSPVDILGVYVAEAGNGWAERFSRSIDVVSKPLQIVALLVASMAAVMRTVSSVRGLFLKRRIRSSCGRGPCIEALGRVHRNVVRATIAGHLHRRFEGEDLYPADIVAEINSEMDEWPLELGQKVELLAECFDAIARSRGFLDVLVTADMKEIKARSRECERFVSLFRERRPVDRSLLADADQGLGQEFANWITSISGAVVISNALSSRHCVLDEVLIWHSRRFRQQIKDGDDESDRTVPRYEDSHAAGKVCLSESVARDERRRLGDFDQRVLVFKSASVTNAGHTGRTGFVLETMETCYAASELGNSSYASELWELDRRSKLLVGSKNLGEGINASSFRLSNQLAMDGGSAAPHWLKSDVLYGSVILLTAYVTPITSDGVILLGQRGDRVKQGAKLISAAAGGIVEPGGTGVGGDVDRITGMPDPAVTVRREFREELGVELEPELLQPAGLFLCNQRNPVGSADGRRRGQIVMSVVYLAKLSESLAQLREKGLVGDQARMRGEMRALVPVEVDGVTAPSGADRCRMVARWAKAHESELDQHALVSLAFATAFLDSVEAAKEAFGACFLDPMDGGSRWVVDPSELVE